MNRLSFFVLLASLAFLVSCSLHSVDGKWKWVRSNASAQDKWLIRENETFEFLEKGRFVIESPNSPIPDGTYTTDTNVTPHRIVIKSLHWNCHGIYKIEGSKLILKLTLFKNQTEFPTDFGIHKEYLVAELERE